MSDGTRVREALLRFKVWADKWADSAGTAAEFKRTEQYREMVAALAERAQLESESEHLRCQTHNAQNEYCAQCLAPYQAKLTRVREALRERSERHDAFTRRNGGQVVKPNEFDELLALAEPAAGAPQDVDAAFLSTDYNATKKMRM